MAKKKPVQPKKFDDELVAFMAREYIDLVRKNMKEGECNPNNPKAVKQMLHSYLDSEKLKTRLWHSIRTQVDAQVDKGTFGTI